jgi:hypothetical protein
MVPTRLLVLARAGAGPGRPNRSGHGPHSQSEKRSPGRNDAAGSDGNEEEGPWGRRRNGLAICYAHPEPKSLNSSCHGLSVAWSRHLTTLRRQVPQWIVSAGV